MPTYEYKCTICDERFEVQQSMKEKALTKLPGEDHEHALKKVFSAVGIAFKGSGFYKNDARGSKSSSSPAETSSTPSESSSSSSNESKSTSSDSSSTSSDSKPKKKTEPKKKSSAKSD